jgi:hypothetical protein
MSNDKLSSIFPQNMNKKVPSNSTEEKEKQFSNKNLIFKVFFVEWKILMRFSVQIQLRVFPVDLFLGKILFDLVE